MPDPMPILSPSTDPLRELARAMNQHAARGDEPDLELGGIAGALLACAADLDKAISRLAEQAKQARTERDHLDRTRPTEWAYKQACKALEKHRERANGVTAERDCLALAVQFALSWDGAGTVHELHKGIREIVATMPAATKEG